MVIINTSRDALLTDFATQLIKKFYCTKAENSPQEAFARASEAYCKNDEYLAQKIYDAVSKGWFMFSSPILSNAPSKDDKKVKSLPISCFLGYVPDTVKGLINHSVELRWLSVKGGGVGGHWSDVRSVTDKSPGPIPFLATVDADMTAYRQGITRKGSYAAYLDVSHPDIFEFITMRTPTGDTNRKCLNLHHGINLTDDFMVKVKNDDMFDLVDPHDGSVRETLKARKIWELILETRYRTGEPYLNFIDTANKHLPQALKDKGLKIHGSNLCNEIHLPTNEDRTAVCCLSSLNIEKFDEWKDTTLVRDLTRFLDNVLTFFIDNCPEELSKAKYSALRERSIGIGAMGFHSYLHKHHISIESEEANKKNKEIFIYIKNEAVAESKLLATERGEAPDMEGTGMRHAHLLAIAPNANSSIIGGCSPSIEPLNANAYTHKTRLGSHLVKNKYLEKRLIKLRKNNQTIWDSIITNKGSVQHLPFLTKEDKDVFKTAIEIDQKYLIKLAAERQKYICQGQSLNLFFPSRSEKKLLHKIHFQAWKKGLKGLYYLRTQTKNEADNVCTACHA